MNSEFTIPNLPLPGEVYDPAQFINIVRLLTLTLQELQSAGQINVNTINVANLPTSATGLRTGDVWSDSGTLKIV